MAKLTEEQWQQLIDYYDDNHSMKECAVMFGVALSTISFKFNNIGKKARPRFQPRDEEHLEKMPAHLQEMWKEKEEAFREKSTEDPGKVSEKPSSSPKRKIISLAGNGGEGRLLYERKVC